MQDVVLPLLNNHILLGCYQFVSLIILLCLMMSSVGCASDGQRGSGKGGGASGFKKRHMLLRKNRLATTFDCQSLADEETAAVTKTELLTVAEIAQEIDYNPAMTPRRQSHERFLEPLSHLATNALATFDTRLIAGADKEVDRKKDTEDSKRRKQKAKEKEAKSDGMKSQYDNLPTQKKDSAESAPPSPSCASRNSNN